MKANASTIISNLVFDFGLIAFALATVYAITRIFSALKSLEAAMRVQVKFNNSMLDLIEAVDSNMDILKRNQETAHDPREARD